MKIMHRLLCWLEKNWLWAIMLYTVLYWSVLGIIILYCSTWFVYILWVAVCVGSYLGGYLYLKIKKTNQQDE